MTREPDRHKTRRREWSLDRYARRAQKRAAAVRRNIRAVLALGLPGPGSVEAGRLTHDPL